MPNITYIIAYRSRPDRLLNLRRILEWLSPFMGLDIILVEQDKESKIAELNLRLKHIFLKSDAPFNKSWAYNVGMKYAKTPIVIFGDADIIMHPSALIEAVNHLNSYDVVNPYNSVIDLTPQESMMDLNTIIQIDRPGRGNTSAIDIEKVPFAGGIYMIRKEAYYKIGGEDESFLSWGGHDDFMSLKMKKFLNCIEIPNKCYHLYHEKAKIDMKMYERNLKILNQFSSATKEQLLNHIKMSLSKIGRLNGFV